MDVDERAVPAVPAAATSGRGPAMDTAIEELGDVLAQLEAQPQNVPLLRRQINLMRQLQMTAEVLETTLKLASLIMLDENTWLSYFDELIRASAQPLTLDGFVEILERFEQAGQDYLSLALLLRHFEFVLACARGQSPLLATTEDVETDFAVETDVTEFLSSDATRAMLQGVLARGEGLLSQSHLLWHPWLEWEMDFLGKMTGSAKAEQIERIHSMYVARLATPHTNMEATSSAYSSFCSEYSPLEYEQRLVSATQASQSAKTKLWIEKRYGKTREDFEQELATGDISTNGPLLVSYISWETDQRAKNPKGKNAPAADARLIRAVFERAVSMYSQAAASAFAIAYAMEAERKTRPKSKKGKGKAAAEVVTPTVDQIHAAKEVVRAFKEAESGVWQKYTAWMDENGSTEESIELQMRSTRACPQSAAVWVGLLRDMEGQEQPIEDLTGTFERALDLGLLTDPDGPTAGVVEIFICRAAFESRLETEVAEGYPPVMLTLLRGMEMISKMERAGDTSLRLEKFLLEWAETRAPEFLDQALLVLDKPNKARSTSYQWAILRAGVEVRRGNVDEAREVYRAAIQRTNLDWPEAVHEAFLQFEDIYGSLETVLDATKQISKEQEKVAKRRGKAAQEQMEQYQQYATAVPVASAPEQMAVGNGMVVEGEAQTVPGPSEPAGPAPAPADGETHIKRDREHTTVLVSGLPKATEAARVDAFFAECGKIRETTMISSDDQDTDSALVEFRYVDDVPLALARDRKKVDGAEVSVSMLWRSTLFVTNFPKEVDDERLRALFIPYGHILQTRWPSRKYAEGRRFCYITMESPATAQNALDLHGTKNGAGFAMSVQISDPSIKAKRSDADKTTLFVGGLNAKTTEEEVKELFQVHGTIKHLKLGYDLVKKICKGFAFVEMATEAEARAGLALHGAHFNGRFLKVELTDPNHKQKVDNKSVNGKGSEQEAFADRRAKSIRLHNLPEGTQEGLLQQALEKVVPVKRLEMFAKSHEAIAVLETQADAGKLLLRSEPFILEGATITFTEQGRRPPPPRQDVANGEGGGGPSALSFSPRIARRGGKALGKGRVPTSDRALPPAFVPAGGASRGQDDFRAMVEVKNKQRGDKLAAKLGNGSVETGAERTDQPSSSSGIKRPNEAEEGSETKRPRTEAGETA